MKPSSRQLSYSRLLRGVFQIDHGGPAASIPLHLCPAAARACATISPARATRRNPVTTVASSPSSPSSTRLLKKLQQQTRSVHTEPAETQDEQEVVAVAARPGPIRPLPVQCYGCGAISQTSIPNEAGYFNPDRNAVKDYTGTQDKVDPRKSPRNRSESDVVRASLQNLGEDRMSELGLDPRLLQLPVSRNKRFGDTHDPEEPLCDRCHNLMHHHHGESIFHPSISAIRETIEQSPYKHNHVYHVLDAADFPMSLLPKIHELLDLAPLRSKNRRAREKYIAGKKTEMSFIITRSDLLAPTKEQVDRMMPYLIETLRAALPRDSRDIRLGNVRCVSAKRSWWTRELREDIWKRGGAGWMVGKVNVGKSSLFHEIFPKGRMDIDKSDKPKHDISVKVQVKPGMEVSAPTPQKTSILAELDEFENKDEGDESSFLLPPPREETNYPRMPIVSTLPGTTASPIRIPFGGGKGELIDLPGVARGELEQFVREEHRESLILKSRMAPEQFVIKDGRSLLIGGFIRITPRDPGLHFLTYAFLGLEPHLTSTEKAIGIQEQTSDRNVENVAVPGTGEKIKHAGAFEVKYDVTKRRTGPLTARDAVGLKVDRLPYRVLSMDILIEGCGWVEITVQVRTKNLFEPRPRSAEPEVLQELDLFGEEKEGRSKQKQATDSDEPNWPIVDVYSPLGKFIGSRPPMNAWVSNKPKKTKESMRKRPRKSMAGAKKREKQERRAAEQERRAAARSY